MSESRLCRCPTPAASARIICPQAATRGLAKCVDNAHNDELSAAIAASTLGEDMDRPDDPGEVLSSHPVYVTIEQAIWVIGTAIVLFMFLSLPSIWTAREKAETELAVEIAKENLEYCTKWGMPAGSASHTACVRDLVNIRAQTEQRVRDEGANSF